MAGSRKAGSSGLNPEVNDLDDGTMIRMLSPRPGPIGAKSKTSVVLPTTRPSRTKSLEIALKVLRQGSRGPEVQRLQRLLNARMTPSPQIAVDGTFGPLTHQIVLQYQRGVSIAVDGSVGKKTWYHLLKGDKATVSQVSNPSTQPFASGPVIVKSPSAARPNNVASSPSPASGIWEWPLEDKFAEALRRTATKLPGSVRHEFEALLSPTSLGIMAGSLVVWAGSHAFGVGEVADIVLLVGGAFFLGMAVFDVAAELGDFLVLTSIASEEKDLDEAASHLARVIAIMGVVAFIALVAKIAKAKGGRGGRTEDLPAIPRSEPVPKAPRPKSGPDRPPEPNAPQPRLFEESVSGSKESLSKAGQVIDKGGLTKAGRSLAKHSAGKRPGSSKFPPAEGNPAEISKQGQAVLEDILNDPGSVYRTRPGKGGERILQVSKPDGTGAIYKNNGNHWEFSHFAENLY